MALILGLLSGLAAAEDPVAVTLLPGATDSESAQLAVLWRGSEAARLSVTVSDAAGVSSRRTDDLELEPGMQLIPIARLGEAGGSIALAITQANGARVLHTLQVSAKRAESDGAEWQERYFNDGLDGPVNAALVFDNGSGPALYLAGSFQVAGTDLEGLGNIVRWDGSSWSALPGGGFNNAVNALAVYQGDLVAAGFFTIAGGQSVGRIARHDGATWSALGPGLNNTVNALAVWDGELFAGGSFTQAGSLVVNRVARWNGNDWQTLTGVGPEVGLTGTAALVDALLPVETFGTFELSELIIGGRFSSAGGVAANNIVRWNRTGFIPLVSFENGTNDRVRALANFADPVFGNEIVAAGSFTEAGGISVGRAARFTLAGWEPFDIDPDFDGTVTTLLSYQGDLIAGGVFTSVAGQPAQRLARWNGTNWSVLSGDQGEGANAWVRTLVEFDNRLVAGGSFTGAGGRVALFAADWDGAQWRGLGGVRATGLSGPVRAATVFNDQLVVAGAFTYAGSSTVNNIARWDGTQWLALEGGAFTGISGTVNALEVFDGQLLIGGSFGFAGGQSIANLAAWSNGHWSAVGVSGPNGVVRDLHTSGSQLFLTGDFVQVDGLTVNGIASWNGSVFSALGQGLSGGAGFALQDLAGDLFVGGSFSGVDGLAVNRVARWSGSSWSALTDGSGSAGVDDDVRAMSLWNGQLILGGAFSQAGGISSPGVVGWTGASWQSLAGASGLGLVPVEALTVHAGELYAGGTFASGDGRILNRVGRFDGSGWQPLSGPAGVGLAGFPGSPPQVSVLLSHAGGLLAGGRFVRSGGLAGRHLAEFRAADQIFANRFE